MQADCSVGVVISDILVKSGSSVPVSSGILDPVVTDKKVLLFIGAATSLTPGGALRQPSAPDVEKAAKHLGYFPIYCLAPAHIPENHEGHKFN